MWDIVVWRVKDGRGRGGDGGRLRVETRAERAPRSFERFGQVDWARQGEGQDASRSGGGWRIAESI